jgi:hypothetical protein
MTTRTHTCRRLLRAALTLVLGTLAVPGAASASYGWPLAPFDRQHPVRGYFGDPRIAGHDRAHRSLHLGVDVSAPDGTLVYATLTGRVTIEPRHRQVVVVRGDRDPGVVFAYWHVVPLVRNGEHVVAYRTPIGRIATGWGHVHFNELQDGVYLNPLRRGGLAPYRDGTAPVVHRLGFERDGKALGRIRLAGRFDLVVEAFDTPALPVPAPWNGKPVAPAVVRWRIAGVCSWRTAVDLRALSPRIPFAHVYARWTRQNHPWGRGGRGRYRFVLARAWDSRPVADGRHLLIVEVQDTAGNAVRRGAFFELRNRV